jgi:hypothetical protein
MSAIVSKLERWPLASALYREQHRAGRYLRGDGEAWTFEDEPGRQAAAMAGGFAVMVAYG